MPGTSTENKVVPLDTFTAENLCARDFGEVRWAVPGLIPEGASILAGKPKMGKSWLALGVALAVASGGVVLGKIRVEPAEVLYLALEDGPRRLQKRLRKLLEPAGMAAPPSLHFTCNVVRGKQALEAVAAWLDGRPTTGLIVIDTLAKFRSLTVAGLSVYEQDYAAIGCLQRLALDRGVPIVAVCHTRKPKNGQAEPADPLEEVTGSMGLTGAADAVLVLNRPRHGREGKLFVVGRDIEERTLPLAWNPDFCTWTQTADQDGPQLSDDQARAVAILEAAGRPLTIKQLTDNFGAGKSYEALKKMILRLASDGVLVKCAYGTYATADNREEGQRDKKDGEWPPGPATPPFWNN